VLKQIANYSTIYRTCASDLDLSSAASLQSRSKQATISSPRRKLGNSRRARRPNTTLATRSMTRQVTPFKMKTPLPERKKVSQLKNGVAAQVSDLLEVDAVTSRVAQNWSSTVFVSMLLD
jgi:hypothetical protein